MSTSACGAHTLACVAVSRLAALADRCHITLSVIAGGKL
jgi:hypothetical protein